ncbi:MAG: hypothetical protein JWQ83_280, partial [Lacunisphaera sp.]|nr:hypothetical protein [Lacunisphaera sp.]
TMAVGTGDVLYTYVQLWSSVREIMLSWNDGRWEHRAYWGENFLTYGANGTTGRHYMGPLPAIGVWTRLEVPASAVGLEGVTVSGMAFSNEDGGAEWSGTGHVGGTTPPPPPPPPANVWFDDDFPAGASAGSGGAGAWAWMANSPAPFSGAMALYAPASPGMHEQYFNFAWTPLALGADDSFFIQVYLDPANPPRELVISFCADNWEHRAYWGENLLNYAADGSPAQHRIGDLSAAGGWVRLEVPASAVGLGGQSVQGLSLTLYDGRAIFDQAGKSGP